MTICTCGIMGESAPLAEHTATCAKVKLERGIVMLNSPVVVEALQFTETNAADVQAFIGSAGEAYNGPSFVRLDMYMDCPKCGHSELFPIAYGVPGDWLFKVGGHIYMLPPALAERVKHSPIHVHSWGPLKAVPPDGDMGRYCDGCGEARIEGGAS